MESPALRVPTTSYHPSPHVGPLASPPSSLPQQRALATAACLSAPGSAVHGANVRSRPVYGNGYGTPAAQDGAGVLPGSYWPQGTGRRLRASRAGSQGVCTALAPWRLAPLGNSDGGVGARTSDGDNSSGGSGDSTPWGWTPCHGSSCSSSSSSSRRKACRHSFSRGISGKATSPPCRTRTRVQQAAAAAAAAVPLPPPPSPQIAPPEEHPLEGLSLATAPNSGLATPVSALEPEAKAAAAACAAVEVRLGAAAVELDDGRRQGGLPYSRNSGVGRSPVTLAVAGAPEPDGAAAARRADGRTASSRMPYGLHAAGAQRQPQQEPVERRRPKKRQRVADGVAGDQRRQTRTLGSSTPTSASGYGDGGAGGEGGDDSLGAFSDLPYNPAELISAIKGCASATALRRLYDEVQARIRPHTPEGLLPPAPLSSSSKSASGLVNGHMSDSDAPDTAATAASGIAGSYGSAAAGGGGLSDLHLVTLLTHLAQLESTQGRASAHVAVQSPASATAGGGGGGQRRASDASPSASVDVAAFGWEVAWELGARVRSGSEIMAQPRAASNAMWAAAKLRLVLVSSWWEAMAGQLLAAAAAPTATSAAARLTTASATAGATAGIAATAGQTAAASGAWGHQRGRAPQPPSGRDLSNGLYGLGLAAFAATGAGDRGPVGRRRRQFEARLQAMGGKLLDLCTAPVLRGCKAQELSSLLYGLVLLRLQPSPTWLTECYSPAMVAVLPSAEPQAVVTVLWALQQLDLRSPPGPLLEALLEATRGMLLRTPPHGYLSTAAPAAPHGSTLITASTGPSCAPAAAASSSSASSLAPSSSSSSSSSSSASSSCSFSGSASSPSPTPSPLPPLPLDLLITLLCTVGRLRNQGALPLPRNHGSEKHRPAGGGDGGDDRGGGGRGAYEEWLAGAVGAVVRILRCQLRVAAGGSDDGNGGGGGVPMVSRSQWVLEPSSLAALARGLALLQVVPASGGSDGDVWSLLYDTALHVCGAGPSRTPPVTAAGGGGGALRWAPRDVSELLSSAVAALDLAAAAAAPTLVRRRPHGSDAGVAAAGGRPPPELVTALLFQLLPSLRPGPWLPRQVAAAKAKAVGGVARRPAAVDDAGACGGIGGRCPGPVLAVCVWALARLGFQPSQDTLAALAVAARGRLTDLPPGDLAQLLWSLAVLNSRLAPPPPTPTRQPPPPPLPPSPPPSPLRALGIAAVSSNSPGRRPPEAPAGSLPAPVPGPRPRPGTLREGTFATRLSTVLARRHTGTVHPEPMLALAAGLRRRVHRAVEHLCRNAAATTAAGPAVADATASGAPGAASAVASATAAGAAAAAAGEVEVAAAAAGCAPAAEAGAPPPLSPRGVVQLLWSLRRLRVPLPTPLLQRLAAHVVLPAVRQLRLDLTHARVVLQRRQRPREAGAGAKGHRNVNQALAPPPAGAHDAAGVDADAASSSSPSAAAAAGLSYNVRMLGAVTSALAGVCRDVEPYVRPGVRVPRQRRVGAAVVRTEAAVGVRRLWDRPTGHALDLRSIGLRRELWAAGQEAVRAQALVGNQLRPRWRRRQGRGAEADEAEVSEAPLALPSGGDGKVPYASMETAEPVALRDWCTYLAGLRRLGCRPRPRLVFSLTGLLAGEQQLQRQVAAPGAERELVGITCELSYLAAVVPQTRSYRALRLPSSGASSRLGDGSGADSEGTLAAGGAVPGGGDASASASDVHLSCEDARVSCGDATASAAGARTARNAAPMEAHGGATGALSTDAAAAAAAAAVGSASLGPKHVGNTGAEAGAGASHSPNPAASSMRGARCPRRSEHRRLQRLRRLVHTKIGPALLQALRRLVQQYGGTTTTQRAPLSVRQTTTLLAALRRLRLRPPPALVVSLLRASCGASSRVAVGGLAAEGPTEAARLVLAASAVLPLLPVPSASLRPKRTTSTASAAAMAAAAVAWLEDVAVCVEGHLAAASPWLLLEELLPVAVVTLMTAAGRAAWMRPVMEERILPAAYAACARALRAGAPLPYICRLLDVLLLLVTRPAAATTDASGVGAAGRRSSGSGANGRVSGSGAAPPEPAASSPATRRPRSAPVLEPWEPRLPESLWQAVFAASYRQMAAAAPQAAADAAAAAAAAEAAAGGGAAGASGGATAPAAAAAARVPGWQLVALAYALARHPPPQGPPEQWMRLLLQGVEADLGSLGARDCADLCVALVRLGCVPGGSWMRRFGVQVELTRALTEKTDHSMISEAWLGLRRFSAERERGVSTGAGTAVARGGAAMVAAADGGGRASVRKGQA